MLHRIRYAMEQPPTQEKLFGIIEADETYLGAKHHGRRGRLEVDGPKTPVFALVQRGGNVRSFPMVRVTSENIKSMLQEHVSEGSAIMTDDLNVYPPACRDFASHEVVNHTQKQYVKDGNVHTNTIEGFFGILKRGINGVYHFVGKKHLHRYLSEFDFRYNSRQTTDGDRTRLAIAGFEGKRLMYRD